jgi:hypothetical protein
MEVWSALRPGHFTPRERAHGTLVILTIVLGWEPGELSGIALGYGMDDRRFESRQGLEVFLYTLSLLSNGYQGLFPWG